MSKKNKMPPIVKFGAWILSLIVFAAGFWHSHLGLKKMNFFNSEYGSIAIAGAILLLILISYNIAIKGNKSAFYFYIIGALFFFIFNLNYFYPSYLSRQLVKEEAIALNDTLQSFSNKIDRMDKSGSISTVSELINIKDKLLDEIKSQDGFGPRAKRYLEQFNAITNSSQLPNRNIGSTEEQRKNIASRYDELLSKDIRNYVIKQIANGKVANAEELLIGIEQLKLTNDEFTPKLKTIILDNSKILLDSIQDNSQIKILQNLVTNIDNSTIKINESSGNKIFTKLNEAESRNIGKFEHTISSVKKRIGKIDTWGVIILCLLLDVIIPLFIYIMIRVKEGDDEDDSAFNLWNKITNKKEPINFNRS